MLVKYSDGTEETIGLNSCMRRGYDINKSGKQTVTVGYGGQTATFTVTFTEEAKKVSALSIASNPTKTTYEIGDSLDTSGGKLKVTYSDKSTEEIDITADMCTGFDSIKTGKQTITVTYGDKTAKFTVTVKEKDKPSTDVFDIGSSDYPTIKDAIAQINKDIKNKTPQDSYTIKLSGDFTEAKAVSLPDVPILVTSDSPAVLTVPSIASKGELTLENIALRTAKDKPVAVTAKKTLTATGCTLPAEETMPGNFFTKPVTFLFPDC